MLDMFAFAGLALLLGFKHSYDADHLLAVANFLRKAHNLAAAIRISVSWAFGHMITAALITTLLYAFRESLLAAFIAVFDKIAGIMLILLGIFSLKDMLGFHSHVHLHNGKPHIHLHLHKNLSMKEQSQSEKPGHGKHIHKHMFGIGIIHGLASNDELLILLTASFGLASLAGILFGVAVFSIGVVSGMVLFAFIFSFPLLKSRSEALYKGVTLVTGAASIAYGGMMLAGAV